MSVARFGGNMALLQQFDSPADLGGTGFGCVTARQQKSAGWGAWPSESFVIRAMINAVP